jgi:hypothetical protein
VAEDAIFLSSQEAMRMLPLFESDLAMSALGRRIYRARLERDASITDNFSVHLELLFATLQPGQSRVTMR